jgi:hypothetical protein
VKAALKWLVALAVVVLVAGYYLNVYYQKNREYAYKLELAELKRRFVTQSVGLRLLDEETYRREVGSSLTDYFHKLDELQKKYPDQFDLERKKKDVERDFAEGRLKKDQKQARDERIALSLELFDKMRQGQYRPLYTAVDKTFRFDVYDIQPAPVAGEKRIKMSYVHWGAFGPVSYGAINGNIRVPQVKGKEVAIPKMESDGPPTLQVEPERWVAEFIPGVEIGYYDLPFFPNEATAVELAFDFTVQSPGGAPVSVHNVFPNIPVPDAWKMAPGEKWEAEVHTATEEELQAAGAPAEDKH